MRCASALVNAPFFLLAYPLLRGGGTRERLGGLFAFAGSAALGGVLVWLPILFWFHARGGLGALVDSILLHNLAYASAIPLDLRLQALLLNPAQIPISQGLVWVLAALGFVLLARSGDRHALVYVGGWALFSAVGVVESCQVIADRETGRSKRFGFVEMDSREAANAAKEKFNGHNLHGKTLKVDEAKPRT